MIRTKIRRQEIGKDVPDYMIYTRFGTPKTAKEVMSTLLSISDPLLLKRTADLYFREVLRCDPERVKEFCEHPLLEDLVNSSADGPLLRFARNYPILSSSDKRSSEVSTEHLYELLIKKHVNNPVKMMQAKAGILNLISKKAEVNGSFEEIKRLNTQYGLVDLVDIEFIIDQQATNKEKPQSVRFTAFSNEEHVKGYYNAFQLFLSPEESFEKLQNYALKGYIQPFTFAKFLQGFKNNAELLRNFVNKLGEHKHYAGIVDILKRIGHEKVDLSNEEVRKAITSEIAKEVEESDGQIGMKGLRKEYNSFCGNTISHVDYTGSKLIVAFTSGPPEIIEWARCGERSSHKVRFTTFDGKEVVVKSYSNQESADYDGIMTGILRRSKSIRVPKIFGKIFVGDLKKNVFERIHGKPASQLLKNANPEEQIDFLRKVLDDYERVLEQTEAKSYYIKSNLDLSFSGEYLGSRIEKLRKELSKLDTEGIDEESAKFILDNLHTLQLAERLQNTGDSIVPTDLRAQNILLEGGTLNGERVYIDHEKFILAHPIIGSTGLLYCPYNQLSEEVIDQSKQDMYSRFGGEEHAHASALFHATKMLRVSLGMLNRGLTNENQKERTNYALKQTADLIKEGILAEVAV
ncbi:hypothetical protein HZA97_02335 [Candidatus Woesearchaeota archaeon]|nr:hypothetical protein [Candidatus Woesearchaeota archaeon]